MVLKKLSFQGLRQGGKADVSGLHRSNSECMVASYTVLYLTAPPLGCSSTLNAAKHF